MRYCLKFTFAKTAFDYIQKEIPEIDIPSYKKRALSKQRAIELGFVKSPNAK